MSWQVSITEEAERDLRAIYSYIAVELRSMANASAQLDRLEKEISALAEMPERYRRYEPEPWYSRGVRRFSVDHYCVFCLPDRETGTVDILRVLYGGRDIDSLMEEYAEEMEAE